MYDHDRVWGWFWVILVAGYFALAVCLAALPWVAAVSVSLLIGWPIQPFVHWMGGTWAAFVMLAATIVWLPR